MRIIYDPKADVMRIRFQEGKYEISKEISDGIVLDMTKDRKIMAIEILDVSERMSTKNLKEITVDVSE